MKLRYHHRVSKRKVFFGYFILICYYDGHLIIIKIDFKKILRNASVLYVFLKNEIKTIGRQWGDALHNYYNTYYQ